MNRSGKELEVWLSATVLDNDQGQPSEIATTERDLDWLPEENGS